MVQTKYGEMTLEQVVDYAEKWRSLCEKQNKLRHQYNQTDKGKMKNRERAKQYYEKHRQEILEKRKAAREKDKDEYKMLE